MPKFASSLYRFLNAHMIYFMLASMLLGACLGGGAKTASFLVPWLFAFMTLATSLKTSWSDLKAIIKKPFILLIIFFVQHLVIPLAAKAVGASFFADNVNLAVGYIVASSLPVGVTAVMWSGLCKGDVALSLAAATLDTLLSPLLFSLSVRLYAGCSVELDYSSLILSLIKMIVLPAILGLTINQISKGAVYAKLHEYFEIPSYFCMCSVIMLNVASAGPAAADAFYKAPHIVLISLIMVSGNFLAGHIVGSLFAKERAAAVSCVFCLGIKNTSAGLVIALAHFKGEASIPILIAMMFQQPLSACLQRFLSHRD